MHCRKIAPLHFYILNKSEKNVFISPRSNMRLVCNVQLSDFIIVFTSNKWLALTRATHLLQEPVDLLCLLLTIGLYLQWYMILGCGCCRWWVCWCCSDALWVFIFISGPCRVFLDVWDHRSEHICSVFARGSDSRCSDSIWSITHQLQDHSCWSVDVSCNKMLNILYML